MKIFATILLATIALTSGGFSQPQGYNYQHQPDFVPIVAAPQQLQQPQQINPELSSPPSQQYSPNTQEQSSAPVMAMSMPMPAGFPGVSNQQPSRARSNVRRYRPRIKITKKPVVTKNFFIHSAPEESEEELQEELRQLAQQPRKHYNVLFVKTPAQTSKSAALNLAKALKEEKTVVYVLSKKTSALDLQDAIAEAPQHINKPEVFFIKYRTPEEAAHAQRQIQSQYDSLGGSSTITDEGVAPITSVVGSLDQPEEEEFVEDQQQLLQEQAPQYDEQLVHGINNIANQYLPPSQY